MIDNIIYKKVGNVNLCFIPKEDYFEKQAMVVFNYGSSENIFTLNGKREEMPAGIAHFLEHKLFEDEEYTVFDVFNKFGGNVNAFTNFHTTAYHFTCVENFYDNFRELLKFVSRPYFTEENVEKEKGIIEQEIKMYDDDPFWKGYFNLISAMYDSKNPITKDIAGSVEDIKKINKDMLYTCYNEFYTNDNLLVICCGDIQDMGLLEKIISENLKLKDKKTAEINYFEEKEDKKEKYIEKDMNIKQQIFNIGFKAKTLEDVKEEMIASKILMDIIFGKSSIFYEKMFNSGIIDNSFSFDYNSIQKFSFYAFSGNSNEAKSLLENIKSEISRIKEEGIKKDDFERIKNKQLSNFISQFNFINSIVSMEADFFSRGFNIQSYYDTFKNITFEKVEERLNSFSEDGYLSLIK